MKVFIKKEKYGFTYKIEGSQGFKYFADGINTKDQMIEYFKQGRHASTKGYFNNPDIIFCNQAGQQSKLYSIKPGEKLAGQRVATVDYEKKFVFDDITTDADKLEFLRFHLPEDSEAEKLESDHDKVVSYLNNANEEIKTLFKSMINDKLTPEEMIRQCEQNAKECYNLPAEIEFIEK